MNKIDIDPEIDTVPVRTHAAAGNRCDGCSPEYTWKWQGWPSGTLVDGPVFYERAPTEPWNPNPSPLPLARFPARRDLSHLFLQPPGSTAE